jgi:hypothetical protein
MRSFNVDIEKHHEHEMAHALAKIESADLLVISMAA